MFPLDTYLIHRFRKKQAGNVFPLLKVSKREKNIFFFVLECINKWCSRNLNSSVKHEAGIISDMLLLIATTFYKRGAIKKLQVHGIQKFDKCTKIFWPKREKSTEF